MNTKPAAAHGGSTEWGTNGGKGIEERREEERRGEPGCKGSRVECTLFFFLDHCREGKRRLLLLVGSEQPVQQDQAEEEEKKEREDDRGGRRGHARHRGRGAVQDNERLESGSGV